MTEKVTVCGPAVFCFCWLDRNSRICWLDILFWCNDII